jgi:hypothetical protein
MVSEVTTQLALLEHCSNEVACRCRRGASGVWQFIACVYITHTEKKQWAVRSVGRQADEPSFAQLAAAQPSLAHDPHDDERGGQHLAQSVSRFCVE